MYRSPLSLSSSSPAEAGAEPPGMARALALRFVAEQPAAVLAQLLVLAVTLALLWPEAPHVTLLPWVGTVILAGIGRWYTWRRARDAAAPEQIIPRLRLSVSMVGLAWGLGAALLIPELGTGHIALLLLIMSALVAAAVGTLTADLLSFRLFVAGMLGPVAPAILFHGTDRFHLTAALLTLCFAAFTLQLHRRGWADSVEQQRGHARLAASEQESRRQHQFLEAILNSVPNAIAVVDPDTTCLGVNPEFEALFGFTADEVTGRRLFDVLVPGRDLEESDAIRLRVLAGETVVTEGGRRRKDGSLVTVRIAAAPVAGEEPPRILLLYTDMTAIRDTERAMRAAQARLELVLASSNAIIYALRLDGTGIRTTWVSENLPRLTGYSVAESMAPDWWVSNLHPEDHGRMLAAQPALLREGHLASEYRFRQKDGSFRWWRDEARLLRDAAGGSQEIIGTWVDITDFKQAEATMQEGRDLAERSARARTEFLANMSHEIRTPLNAVLGLTELLLDTELTAEQGHSLRLVQAAGESLLVLLNDILDLSKIEAEHLALESIPFDLRYLLESTAGLLAVRVADRDIEMVVDVAGEVPHQLVGDPTRLRQVLSNLVGNALKFTERGEVVLSAAVAGGEP
ncbi:MAG: PAS domain S-box protein, partial [Gemmatimonadota bacterium]|nr:PAS domain S-box protein [Gemmatimonadota bacterium]